MLHPVLKRGRYHSVKKSKNAKDSIKRCIQGKSDEHTIATLLKFRAWWSIESDGRLGRHMIRIRQVNRGAESVPVPHDFQF